MTQVAIYSIVCLGLALLVGRVGMVSLGQGAVLAMGAWVAARLLFATGLPFPVILLLGGADHHGARHARRASGAADERPLPGPDHADARRARSPWPCPTINFPNGGGGFTGYNGGSVHIPAIRRPSIATSDPAFFRYAVIVAMLMFLLVLVHVRGRPGRAWAAIRQSRVSSAGRRHKHHASTSCGPSRWRRSSPAWPEVSWPAASAI